MLSRYTRDSGHFSIFWYHNGWIPFTNKHQSTKSSYSGWSKRCTRGNSGEHEGRRSCWDDGEAQDSADNTEGVAVEGKEKTHRSVKGTVEDGVAVRDTKENVSEQESVKDFVAREKRLWELQKGGHFSVFSLFFVTCLLLVTTASSGL